MTDQPDDAQREHVCVLCPQFRPKNKPRFYDRAQVCKSCRGVLDRILDTLPDDYARLPLNFPRTAAPQITGTKVRSTPQPTEPINWWPYDLTLPARQESRELAARSALGIDTDQIGDLSAATILETWVLDWAAMRREHPPRPYVSTMCIWLRARLEWACDKHPRIADFAAEIRELSRTVAAAARTDHGRGENIGPCPVELRDGTRCGATLRVDPYVDQIQCTRCGTRWDRRKREWLHLRAEQLKVEMGREGQFEHRLR